jgi:magnesium-transporting ATPase (P-type)
MAQKMFDVRGPEVTRHSLHNYNHGTSIINTTVLLAFLVCHVICFWLEIGYEHKSSVRVVIIIIIIIIIIIKFTCPI